MYRVENRTKETLIPIIQKHVAPGSHIFSDVWGAYSDLNSLGIQHFTVTHKSTFKATYRNVDTENCKKSIQMQYRGYMCVFFRLECFGKVSGCHAEQTHKHTE